MRRRSVDGARALKLGGLLAAGSLLLGMWLSYKLSAWRARFRGRAANIRGQRGERAAEKLLARRGYRTLARQAQHTYPVQLGDETVDVTLSADFVVERSGRTYVAEVKTGERAPRFENAETRRQLLEYQLGFGVDSVLLVDVDAGELREVRFPIARPRAPLSSFAWILCMAGVAGGLFWLFRQ